jgi:hypothetical protein
VNFIRNVINAIGFVLTVIGIVVFALWMASMAKAFGG